MSKTEVSYRRPLNDKQLKVLRLLYCYRFGTCKYVAQYLGKKDLKVVQKKLKILEEQKYIAKRYEKSYKLQGRPAEYYLTPKGARILMKHTEPDAENVDIVTEKGIKRLYQNSSVSLDYVAHCVRILMASLHFSTIYGWRSHFLTSVQLTPFDFLPTWRSDGVINLEIDVAGEYDSRLFFIDIWDGTKPFFVSVKKTLNYLTYFENGDWPPDEGEFPIVLMVCDSKRNEIKLRRQIRKALRKSYEEVVYATTTMGVLEAIAQLTDGIWKPVEGDNDLEIRAHSLKELASY